MFTFVGITRENIKMIAIKSTGLAKRNRPKNYRILLIKTSSFANFTGAARQPLILLVFLSLLIFGSFNAQAAATYYVRADANGANNGSDWSNAYTTLPASLQRGATYYIADGTYGGYTFNDDNSGSTLITIKKATVSDHGTGSGWSSSYGNGQAVFNSQLVFSTDYWFFDGVSGGGPGSWESGYGFKVARSGGGATKCFKITGNYVTIRHVDVENSGEDVSGNADNFYVIGGNYLKVQYVWTHDTNRTNFLLDGSHHFLLENSLISERHSTDGTHGEHISINNSGSNAGTVIRNNIFRNSTNTGTIIIKDSVQSGFKIYGNVFYQTNNNRYYNSNGVIADTGGDTTTNVEIYNNTFLEFVNGNGDPSRTTYFQSSSGNVFKNNIVFGSGGINGISTRSHNLYDASSIISGETEGQYFSSGKSALFTNPSSHDYTLKIATNAGDSSISAQYKIDMFGNTRGADGSLDRGAFEYGGDGAANSVPSPPTGLHLFSE